MSPGSFPEEPRNAFLYLTVGAHSVDRVMCHVLIAIQEKATRYGLIFVHRKFIFSCKIMRMKLESMKVSASN